MLTIEVELDRCGFHGLRDTGEPDWPPSPRRVLGALLAGAHDLPEEDPTRDRALAALRRMASAPQPVIDAPLARPLGLPDTYAPKTWLPDTTRAMGTGTIVEFLDLSLVGMNTQSRTRKPQDGVALAAATIRFHVDLDCDHESLAALDAAARRVPYFGTSKDPATLGVERSGDLGQPLPPLFERWYPDTHVAGSTHGWLPTTVDWFEANYQRTFGRDEAIAALPPIPPAGFVREVAYGRRRPAEHVEFPVVPLTRSVPHHRIPVLMNKLAERDGIRSGWRILPLTVSHERAEASANGDGRCVGIALMPLVREDPLADEQAGAGAQLARCVAALPEEAGGLVVGRSGALDPVTWVGPSRSWHSTTPLRAFPDERVVRHALATELAERYGVELDQLALRRTPRIRSNGRWPEGDLADGLDQWWVEFTVRQPIEGPLSLGAAAERGFGMFRPRS